MSRVRTPVAFFVFNRPELTARVFERIRQAQPERLFLVCDGPRASQPEDGLKVESVRQVVAQVDWPCEVECNFSDANLGCRHRVASGLNWVFERVEEAIILEDDTLPDPSFFRFCQELLARYRDDLRVMHVGGCNLAAPHMRIRESYWFTRHAWIWGWATWRRAWKHYDFMMETWEERLAVVERTFSSRWERQFWFSAWDECRRNPESANTWDFPWMFSVRAVNGLAVLPTVNLIENIGFGESATHTAACSSACRLPAAQWVQKRPTSRVAGNRFYDELLTRVYSGDALGFVADVYSHLRLFHNSWGIWRRS